MSELFEVAIGRDKSGLVKGGKSGGQAIGIRNLVKGFDFARH
jgi:hypothetical protein